VAAFPRSSTTEFSAARSVGLRRGDLGRIRWRRASGIAIRALHTSSSRRRSGQFADFALACSTNLLV
jgi:hypothetical protein